MDDERMGCLIHNALAESEDPKVNTELCQCPVCCPVNKAMFIFEGKWNVQILFTLFTFHSLRFGELQKHVPGISKTMLSATLRKLEEYGLVHREQFNEIPPHVEYSLTEGGNALKSVFAEIAKWSSVYMKA